MRFRRHAVSRVGVSVEWALISWMDGLAWRRRLVRRSVSHVRRDEAILWVSVQVWRRPFVPEEGIMLFSAVGHRRRLAVWKRRY